jgi:hypothetical protein
MVTSSKNHITVFNRLAFIERIIDGLKPASELSFDELYQRWIQADFFKELALLGHVSVSYNNGPEVSFKPGAEDANRHQALALSCFVSSVYADTNSIVESPHELGNIFTATFSRSNENCICYVNEYGTVVRFTFDKNQKSQFEK